MTNEGNESKTGEMPSTATINQIRDLPADKVMSSFPVFPENSRESRFVHDVHVACSHISEPAVHSSCLSLAVSARTDAYAGHVANLTLGSAIITAVGIIASVLISMYVQRRQEQDRYNTEKKFAESSAITKNNHFNRISLLLKNSADLLKEAKSLLNLRHPKDFSKMPGIQLSFQFISTNLTEAAAELAAVQLFELQICTVSAHQLSTQTIQILSDLQQQLTIRNDKAGPLYAGSKISTIKENIDKIQETIFSVERRVTDPKKS